LAGKIAGKLKKLLGAIKKGFGNRLVKKRKDDQVVGPNSTSSPTANGIRNFKSLRPKPASHKPIPQH
jgi:hypothetical protein